MWGNGFPQSWEGTMLTKGEFLVCPHIVCGKGVRVGPIVEGGGGAGLLEMQ